MTKCVNSKKYFDEELVRIFRANKICGNVLKSLNEPDVKELVWETEDVCNV